jgi:hypothetical protein
MITVEVEPTPQSPPTTLEELVGDRYRNWAGLEALTKTVDAKRLVHENVQCSHQTLREYAKRLSEWGDPGFSDLPLALSPEVQVALLKVRKQYCIWRNARSVRQYLVRNPI